MHIYLRSARHPIRTTRALMSFDISGEASLRPYSMFKIHMSMIVVSLLATIPVSVYLTVSGFVGGSVTMNHIVQNLILALVVPPVGLFLSALLFEIYCRKIQKTHTYYRTYGQMVSVREFCEWLSPKILDYFTKWDAREGTSRRDQWFIQQLAHGDKAIESHASRSDGKNRLTVLTRSCRIPHDADLLRSIREVQMGSGSGPSVVVRAHRQSAMSVGSVTEEFTEAMSRGAAGLCETSTGEGSLYDVHLAGGPNVNIEFQIGTGYFGCRNLDGTFNLAKLVAIVTAHPEIFGLQIKLSQCAKQTGGAMLANKMTPRHAEVRGVPAWEDCFSPPTHSAFGGLAGLPGFIKMLREATGLVVGIKLAVGSVLEIDEMCQVFASFPEGIPDSIQVDYGDGTGAAYAEAIESSARKDISALQIVDLLLRKHGIRDRIRLISSGRIFKPNDLMRAYAMGADICATARGFKYAAGCGGIRRCHVGKECVSGVAGNGHALDPIEKGERIARWVDATHKRTAGLIAVTGIGSLGELIGTRDRHVDFGGVHIWTPRDIDRQLAIETRDFRDMVDAYVWTSTADR